MRQAIEQWLEVAELEDTTRERYDDLIRLYIVPTFGTLPASKLRPVSVPRSRSRPPRGRPPITRSTQYPGECQDVDQ